MQQGESLALYWSGINWETGIVSIRGTLTDLNSKLVIEDQRKTWAGIRDIVIPAQMLEVLASHRARMVLDGHQTTGDNLVFCKTRGNIINRQNLLQRTFNPLCRATGVPVIHWHDLCHTTATLLLEADIPITNVSELLGHSSSVVTANIYSHVTNAQIRRVAAAAEELFDT